MANQKLVKKIDIDLAEGYKMTELGQLPEEWYLTILVEETNIKQSKSSSTNNFTDLSYSAFDKYRQIGYSNEDQEKSE